VLKPILGDPDALLSLNVEPKVKLTAWLSSKLVVLGFGVSKKEGDIVSTSNPQMVSDQNQLIDCR